MRKRYQSMNDHSVECRRALSIVSSLIVSSHYTHTHTSYISILTTTNSIQTIKILRVSFDFQFISSATDSTHTTYSTKSVLQHFYFWFLFLNLSSLVLFYFPVTSIWSSSQKEISSIQVEWSDLFFLLRLMPPPPPPSSLIAFR